MGCGMFGFRVGNGHHMDRTLLYVRFRRLPGCGSRTASSGCAMHDRFFLYHDYFLFFARIGCNGRGRLLGYGCFSFFLLVENYLGFLVAFEIFGHIFPIPRPQIQS